MIETKLYAQLKYRKVKGRRMAFTGEGTMSTRCRDRLAPSAGIRHDARHA